MTSAYARLTSRLHGARRFARDALAYGMAARGTAFSLAKGELRPMLDDFAGEAGTARGHYFHQDLWAARRIFEARPARHLDVGSRVDGFVAHVLAFMPVTVVDRRPLDARVDGLTFLCTDATLLPMASASEPSVSSLHAVEHVGLGRYGDRVDPEGAFAAMAELVRVVAPGGRLYLGLPVGRERVVFNAHRIFRPSSVIRAIGPLELIAFAAVSDEGRLVEGARPDDFADADYACGLFEFARR